MPPAINGAAGAMVGGFPRPFGISLPNQTVYINNLNDKISKELLRRYVRMHRYSNYMLLAV